MPQKSPKPPTAQDACESPADSRVEDPAAPLTEHYRGFDVGPEWHLYCRKCGRGWSLTKAKADNPGNLLHLLNHARSH